MSELGTRSTLHHDVRLSRRSLSWTKTVIVPFDLSSEEIGEHSIRVSTKSYQ